METKADWLRSEIERLEEVIGLYETQCIEEIGFVVNGDKIHQALTSIITRYKEELKVLESK